MKRYRKEVVFDKEEFEEDWPSTNTFECIDWFTKKLKSIPEEYQANAQIIFNSNLYQEGNFVQIEISYSRPETDVEESVRKAQEQLYVSSRRDKELKLLADLKAKYES